VAQRQPEFYALPARGIPEIRALGLSWEEALWILGTASRILIAPETTPLPWMEAAHKPWG
jgi:hypothetical protein